MTAFIKSAKSNSIVGLELKRQIHFVYKSVYGALVYPNPDKFIYVENNGEICSCFSITFTHNKRLFSEQYIDFPVEHYLTNNGLSRVANSGRFSTISRKDIVEVGSCIAIKKGWGLKLYQILPIVLNLYKIKYALVTLTTKVQQIFNNLGFTVYYLANAERYRVANKQVWGTFYDTNPKTFLFDITKSLPLGDYQSCMNQLGLSLTDELDLIFSESATART